VALALEVYGPYITKDKKGVKQLLVQCQNALYSMMVASLLYYLKFMKSLMDVGFELNLYNPCVTNTIIDSTQMIICFHGDDCKLSHHSPKLMDDIFAFLHKEYESIFKDGSGKMTVSCGKVHKYLGITLDYTVCGQVKISMFDYVNEILTAFDKAEPKVAGTKTSAAPEHLFKVDEDCEKFQQAKLWSFTTWWPKLCTLPREPDQTPALLLHS